MLKAGAPLASAPQPMILLQRDGWEIAAWCVSIAAVAAVASWLVLRRRPTAEELEKARRLFLVQSGRIVDGMLLDAYEVPSDDGRILTMLLFNYRIGGVDYECSQDISLLEGEVNAADVRAGFPCSVRYQPGNPQNSIVIAEGWSGLREGLPQLPAYDDPDSPDHTSSPLADK
jgi:hypothetical protein